jgi:aspartate racemase
LTEILVEAAQTLERGGAGGILICTNTMHRLYDQVSAAVAAPVLHIADATGRVIRQAGHTRVGLLGTAFTMEQDFYKRRLAEKFGLDVIVPDETGRRTVHDIIYGELVAGVVTEASRDAYRQVIQSLAARGAEAVILGCTEIGLLISDADSSVPIYDTTRLHAMAAVDWALRPKDAGVSN